MEHCKIFLEWEWWPNYSYSLGLDVFWVLAHMELPFQWKYNYLSYFELLHTEYIQDSADGRANAFQTECFGSKPGCGNSDKNPWARQDVLCMNFHPAHKRSTSASLKKQQNFLVASILVFEGRWQEVHPIAKPCKDVLAEQCSAVGKIERKRRDTKYIQGQALFIAHMHKKYC